MPFHFLPPPHCMFVMHVRCYPSKRNWGPLMTGVISIDKHRLFLSSVFMEAEFEPLRMAYI